MSTDVSTVHVGPDGGSHSGPPGPGLARGTELGRYLVLDRIASGGFGTVYAAFDPDLDRKVALKVLHEGLDDEDQARLVREAQTMAKVSHPNIVAVHDVGVLDGRAFVAVELVEGRTLDQWLSERERSVSEIVETFAAAARGLAAAHRAGIVHRDFKPSNVLMGPDGRARVTDFGVAVRLDEDPELADVAGTPGYMAPEQYDSKAPADPRSDQFSLCASLFEALHGRSAFDSKTAEGITAAGRRGEIPNGPWRGDAPAWLRKVLLRGLAPDPAARYGSMDELARELSRDRGVLRRPAVWAAVLAVGGLGLWLTAPDPAPRCQLDPGVLDGSWDPDVRDRIEAAFAATEDPAARQSFETVRQRLDAWTGGWLAARLDACEATHVRGEQSQRRLDLRMSCLERRRSALTALTRELAQADAGAVQRAVDAVYGLPEFDSCAAMQTLELVEPLPGDPALRERIEELERALADITALRQTGRVSEAESALGELVDHVEDAGHGPLTARTMLEAGRLWRELGRFEQARDDYYRGLAAAKASTDLESETQLWIDLVYLVGRKLGQHDEALRQAELAQAAIGASQSDSLALPRLDHARSVVLRAAGDNERARAIGTDALARWEEQVGPDDPRLVSLLIDIGNIHLDRREGDAAGAYYTRALEIVRATRGPTHPHAAKALMNLCGAHMYVGRTDEARRYCEQALAIREAALPADHPEIAETILNLGVIAIEQGAFERAEELYERGVPMILRAYGSDHENYAIAIGNRGTVACKRGRFEAGLADLREALGLRERRLPPHAWNLVSSRLVLAECLEEHGDVDGAIEQLQRAVEDTAGAPESAIRGAALARWTLAQALSRNDRDPERSLSLAKEARALFDRVDALPSELVAWLEERESEARPP